MKSILVPTDFSEASYNAAQYVMSFAETLNIKQVILYNVYVPITFISDDTAMTSFVSPVATELSDVSEEGLKNFREKLAKNNSTAIELKTVSDYNNIKDGILSAAKEYDAEMIVMAIRGATDKLNGILIGSNAVDVARESEVPVLMIPSGAAYVKLQRVLFACDLKEVLQTTPVAAIKRILDAIHAELFVLHVEADANNFNSSINAETLMLDNLLGSYNPKYHFAANESYTEAIDKFATANNIDLIITIPRKHGFFEGIFKRSHTKALAFHTHIPLLAIHE